MRELNRRHALLSGLAMGVGAWPALAVGQSFSNAIWSKGAATALCIGCSNYQSGENLETPRADALEVARHFIRLGYETEVLLDPSRQDILVALAHLRLRSSNAGTCVIYFAGHGVMLDGEVHALPSDFALKDIRAGNGMIPERTFATAISEKPRRKILLFDSCRTNPFVTEAKSALHGSMGLNGLAGLFSGYGTQPGAPAFDGGNGNSPFAKAIIRNLGQRPKQIEDFFKSVRLQVVRETSGLQIPWTRSSLLTRVSLHAGSS